MNFGKLLTQQNITRCLRLTLLSAICGVLSASSAALFLELLQIVTQFRMDHAAVIFLLPLAGLIIGWCYRRIGKSAAQGQHLMIDEIHAAEAGDPSQNIPVRIAPLVLFTTLITHAVGGSAGREGTAVQMGGALAAGLSRYWPFGAVSRDERRGLLIAGIGSAFGSAIGAPLAGWLFGMEVLFVRRLRLTAIAESTIASAAAYAMTRWLAPPHSVFGAWPPLPFDFATLGGVAVLGALCGLSARFFVGTTHAMERSARRWVASDILRPFWGGAVLLAIYQLPGTSRYAGLGMDVIQQTLSEAAYGVAALRTNVTDALAKLALTALTLSTGFKGGEFVPLVFAGVMLGCASAAGLHLPPLVFALSGFAALFAGASNTPLACTLMAIELFGYPIAPYAAVACGISFLTSGPRGIYTTQR